MNDFSAQLSQYILSRIDEQIETSVKRSLEVKTVTVDFKGLVAMTHMSKSFLYKSVIDTPEFLAAEHDLGNKRLWDVKKVSEAWKSYVAKHGKPGTQRLPTSLRKEFG